MSAPYTVRFGVYHAASSAPLGELPAAIHRCREIRAQAPSKRWPARIYGDNIDLGCADGLDDDEREQIEAGGL